MGVNLAVPLRSRVWYHSRGPGFHLMWLSRVTRKAGLLDCSDADVFSSTGGAANWHACLHRSCHSLRINYGIDTPAYGLISYMCPMCNAIYDPLSFGSHIKQWYCQLWPIIIKKKKKESSLLFTLLTCVRSWKSVTKDTDISTNTPSQVLIPATRRLNPPLSLKWWFPQLILQLSSEHIGLWTTIKNLQRTSRGTRATLLAEYDQHYHESYQYHSTHGRFNKVGSWNKVEKINKWIYRKHKYRILKHLSVKVSTIF